MSDMSIRQHTIWIFAGLVVAANAGAQNVDTSEWVCEFCPFESGHRGDYDVGASAVSDDSAYFDDASGYGDEGVVVNVDGSGSYAGESQRLDWAVEDLGLDSRFAKLRGGRPGSFDYNVSYRELPRRQYITTESIFVASGGSQLDLPSGWARAGSTAGFSALDSSLVDRDIESDRSMFGIGGRYFLSDSWQFTADFRRQEHDGNDILGGSYFTTASLLPMPFDYTTDEVDLGIRYNKGNGYLAIGWYLSDFENDSEAFRWESPFTTSAGAEFAELAQPPDNSFQQLKFSGGYRFVEQRTYATFSVSTGQIEQDESLLAYTTNANLSTTPLPADSLDGEIDTLSYAFAVVSSAIDKARFKLDYRYDERDNGTPSETWNRIIADTFLSNDPEMNIPYSYERSKLSLSADYDVLDTVRVSAGYDRRDVDRDFQEVAEQTEDTGWGRVRWQPNALISLDVKGGTSKRDPKRYNETVAIAFGQNPLLRKYNLAYRYREFGELDLTASLPNTPVSLTLSAAVADDSYTQSQLGLTDADESRLAADLSWSVSERGSLYINGGVDSIEYSQLGSEFFATSDWQAAGEDEFVNYGVGFRVRELGENFDVEFDYTRSDGTSEIDVASAAGGQSRFPDLESTLDYLRLRLTYRQSERLEWLATVRLQRFETEDWSLEGVAPATLPNVLSLGAEPYDDEVVIVGLSVRYRAGDSN